MKKTIRQPDGSEVVFEGTAEELAELENRVQKGGKTESIQKKKRLLTEQQLQQVREVVGAMLLDQLLRMPQVVGQPYYVPVPQTVPNVPNIIPWIQPIGPLDPLPAPWIVTTTTGQDIKLDTNLDCASNISFPPGTTVTVTN